MMSKKILNSMDMKVIKEICMDLNSDIKNILSIGEYYVYINQK